MRKLAKFLTNYIILKGMIQKNDQEIYEYGFEIAAEIGLFGIFCLFIVIYLHMFFEGILFFVVFVPLRSYAGGLHLKKYHSCFILSCLTFSGVLLMERYIQIPIWISFIAFLILEIMVYILYPVENVNRKIDEIEEQHFRRKLKQFLMMDLLMTIVCVILGDANALGIIMLTFVVVVITMLIGKCKNMLDE